MVTQYNNTIICICACVLHKIIKKFAWNVTNFAFFPQGVVILVLTVQLLPLKT